MRTALGIVNIVTEAQNILMKLIDILECTFHDDVVTGSFERNDFMNRIASFINIFDKTYESARFMEFDLLGRIHSSVFKYNRQIRV